MATRLSTMKALSILGIVFWFAAASLLAQTGNAPVVPINSVVNNASYAPGSNVLAPGSIAAIFGSNLTDGTSCVHAAGCDQTFDSTGHLGTTMAGAQVTINGSPVPIFYATPGQLGIQIPTELTGTSATLQVTVNGQSSPARTFSIGPFAAGIFTSNQQGTGSGAITHADGTTVNSGNPARPGETLIIYATGLGQVTPALATGTKPTGTVSTVTLPTITIDGLSAVVQFSGISGCCVGLNQVNVVVPSNVHTGTNVNVLLSIGGKQSNTASIFVAAPFPPPVQFTLTILKAGTGTGTATANPTGPTYIAGTVVTLTAIPSNGSTFSGWSGACSGTGSCTVTMNSNVTVTATFTAPPPPPTSDCAPTIESTISGTFNGWDGQTVFILDNGQIWQQAEYAYMYSYSYRPHVTIYQTSSGCRMQVERVNTTILVRRIPRVEYPIQVSINDERFVINGTVFKAKTYCFNMREGDKVIFLSGSALGVCTSAELLNLRTGNVCRVWCF